MDMARFYVDLNEIIEKHSDDLLTLRESLIYFRDHGMDQGSVLNILEKLRAERDSESEAVLLDLMDLVVGWCKPEMAIFP